MRRRAPRKTGYPDFSFPTYTEHLYALVLYEKTNYGHSSTLHKKETWGVYQVLGNHKKRISLRVGTEQSHGICHQPAGKKLKQLKVLENNRSCLALPACVLSFLFLHCLQIFTWLSKGPFVLSIPEASPVFLPVSIQRSRIKRHKLRHRKVDC